MDIVSRGKGVNWFNGESDKQVVSINQELYTCMGHSRGAMDLWHGYASAFPPVDRCMQSRIFLIGSILIVEIIN